MKWRSKNHGQLRSPDPPPNEAARPTRPNTDLDLTKEQPTTPVTIVTLEREQEKTRSRLAGGLVAILGLVVVTPLVPLLGRADLDTLTKYLDLVLSPMVGLVGTVLGFYFGQRSK